MTVGGCLCCKRKKGFKVFNKKKLTIYINKQNYVIMHMKLLFDNQYLIRNIFLINQFIGF